MQTWDEHRPNHVAFLAYLDQLQQFNSGENEQEAKKWARAAEIAKTIIADILASEDERIQRAASFRELHDYCDANVLGDQEKAFEEAGGTGESDEADAAAHAAMDEVLERAQTIVDHWLKTRR
jgi:hypothetical protein